MLKKENSLGKKIKFFRSDAEFIVKFGTQNQTNHSK